MRTIYAIQLRISPIKDLSPTAIYNDIATRVSQWIENKYDFKWQTRTEVPVNGQTISPLDGHSVRGLVRTAGDSQLFTVEWKHPEDNDPLTAWVSTCTVARNSEAIQFELLVRISTMRTVLRPVRFELGRPRIVSEILSTYETSIDGWITPTSTTRLTSPQVQSFVDDILLNTRRNLPVIVVSPNAWNHTYAVDPQELFDRLRGFAHVVALVDKWAAFTLTDVVERHLSCFDGAVRIYWPGFTLNDNPYQHRLFLPQWIRSHNDDGLPLKSSLFRTLAAVASFRYTEGEVVRRARQAIAEKDREHLLLLRDQVRTGTVEKEALATQLLKAWEENDRLVAERDQLKDDLTAQKAAWIEVQQAIAGESVGTTQPPEQKQGFATVLDAVIKAKNDFSGPLVFLESVIESAKESPYQNPDRVYELFEALYLVASEWKENGGSLGRNWNDIMAEFGFDLRDQISTTARGKWGDEYSFVYKGHKQLFEKHITIGAKQPAKCLSVHWYRDDHDHQLIIGHCGRHLTNTSA